MKNKIYIFGIVLMILFTTGAIFKLNHWPGAAIMIAASLVLFSLVYCPLALVSAYRAERAYPFIYLIGGMTIAINFIGALFKIMHWPGAGIMLTIAIISPFILFLPAFLVYQGKRGTSNIKNLILVLFLLVYISAMDALMALNVSKSVIDDALLVNEQYTSLANYYKGSANGRLTNIDPDPDPADVTRAGLLATKTDSLVEEINQLKAALVTRASASNQEALNRERGIDIHRVVGFDNRNVSSQVMMVENGAMKLKQGIRQYKDFLKEITGADQSAFIDKYLNTDDMEWEGTLYPWEEVYFKGAMLVWAINHLTSLEFRVRMVEDEVAGKLSDQDQVH